MQGMLIKGNLFNFPINRKILPAYSMEMAVFTDPAFLSGNSCNWPILITYKVLYWLQNLNFSDNYYGTNFETYLDKNLQTFYCAVITLKNQYLK